MKARLLPITTVDDTSKHPTTSFTKWLAATQLTDNADVPCGSCNACCRSSYFIHIRPEDTDALRHIPANLLFDAPGLPKGNLIMGYNEHGACPMLIDNQCSIYAHRPQTCRDYDCRVFAATGIAAGGTKKADVNERAASWQFDYPSVQDSQEQAAVQAAATFLVNLDEEHDEEGLLPTNPTQIALLAIRLREIFRDPGPSAQVTLAKVIEFIKTGLA